jgi:ATP-dependent exoDNAse (exonuclease V) beta subunit
MNLSPEQQAVVDAWGRGVAVMAGAGSGKTTTLVLKCIELLRRKPDARFAAVSFTERSAGDLRAKLSEMISKAERPDGQPRREGGPLAGHWVMTIHGLCGAIIQEFPREAGYDGGEGMLSESESFALWERAIGSLWLETLPEGVNQALDAMLVRESRDGLARLLARTRELAAFGVLDWLVKSDEISSRHLAVLSEYVLERYQRAKRRNGALDFNDLELGAERALAHAEVRRAFRDRFDLVLVDEFQDTNPVQARIIRAFCREDLSNLCVVGDPKQSIYRFRDADVTLFEEFCVEMGERHSLTWNFRSRPGIIDYANGICAPAFAESEMPYEALIPKREVSPDVEPVLRLEIREPADLARFITQEAARGVPLSDMALLMRRIRGNEKWLKALSSAGIPIAVGSGGLFWEDPRIRELVAFLRWWDDPGNTLSGAVFLRAPWVGVPDSHIDAWIGPRKRDPVLGPPLWDAFFASGHPISLALAPFRAKAARPAELLFSLFSIPGVEDDLGAPLLGLWHRAEELSARGLDFHAVVAEFTAARDASRRERDVPPPRNQGQLTVLTLHASKGLEFRHVILLDFGPKGRAPDAPMLFWDRAKGVFLGVRDEDGERDPKHPVESLWRAEERRKALAESKRLFYVALTRAQERLILVCPELPVPPEKAPPKRPVKEKVVEPVSPFSVDYWRDWLDHAPLPDRILTPNEIYADMDVSRGAPTGVTPPTSSNLVAKRVVLRRSRHSVTEWNALSRCPRNYEWTFIRPVEVAPGLSEIGLYTGERVESAAKSEVTQQELGSRVHACLEHADYDGLKALEREVGIERFAADSVTSWALSAPFMAPPAPELGREVWAELAFEVRIAGEVLVGSMDRVVLGSTLALVDFKVTEKPKSVEALLEAYRLQIELYDYALEKLVTGSSHEAIPREALLVNIAPRTIQAVPVPLAESASERHLQLARLEDLARLSASIVAGEEGRPRPGPLCRVCEFRAKCPEGAKSVAGGSLSS